MSGVSAIQQSQVKSNGGKQAVQRSPLQIAAGHGQTTANFFMRSRAKPQGTTAWAAVDFKIDGWEAVTP